MLTEEMKKLIWDSNLRYSPETLLSLFKQSSPETNEGHDTLREICKSTAMNAIQTLDEMVKSGADRTGSAKKLMIEYKNVFKNFNENGIIFDDDVPLYALKALYEALLAKKWIVNTPMTSFFANCYQDGHLINLNSLSNAGTESKSGCDVIINCFPIAPKRGHRVEAL